MYNTLHPSPVMRFLFRVFALTVLILTSFLFIHSKVQQTQLTAYTKLDISTGENGELIASVPLNLPNGTFVQPVLSLSYSHHSGNGFAGLGWNLEGVMQSITRVPATMAQDGFIDGVDFDSQDRFALNGERLMVVKGVYGADASEYRTEQYTFSKVVAYGNTGNGPEKFKVWTKDGLMLEFGFTADARIEASGSSSRVLLWALNRIEDVNGNYLTVNYVENNANGEFRPVQINYTGNTRAGIAPYNKIVLGYETRPDATARYLEGHKFITTQRLKEITAYEHTTVFRRYALTYGIDTLASKLVRITEYASDNSTMMNPVEVGWIVQPAVAGFTGAGTGNWGYSNSNATIAASTNTTTVTGDYNGDGKTDLLAINKNTDGTISKIVTAISANNAFSSYDGISYAPGVTPGKLRYINTGDFNGDGKTDLLVNAQISNLPASIILIGIWNGNGITLQATNISSGLIFPSTLIGDFNSDGKSDIAYNKRYNGVWNIYLSNSGTDFTLTSWYGSTNHDATQALTGDFNGDGKTDIAAYGVGTDWNISIAGDEVFSTTVWTGPSGADYYYRTATGDFNGDGLSDIATWTTAGVWMVGLSNGKDFNTQIWTGGHNDPEFSFTGDFNGDGKTDVAAYNTTNQWKVCLSTGNSFLNQIWSGHNTNSQTANYIGDFNGDGIADMAGNNNQYLSVTLSNAGKDFISHIKNGHGIQYDFAYSPLTDTTIFTPGTIGTYPSIDFRGALYVTRTIATDNGIGGKWRKHFTYAGGRFNLHGRGFRGFDKTIQIDSAANNKSIVYYERDYKCIGAKVKKIEQYTLDNKLLHVTDNVIDMRDMGNNVNFSFYKKSTERSYELSGTETESKTTEYIYDNWGNATQVKETWNNGYTITTSNAFANDTIQWRLGRLTETVVNKQMPGKAAVTKDSRFVYNADGNLMQEILLPNHPSRKLQTNYAHDLFGNRVVIETSGPGITTRDERFLYDSEGRNLIQSTNAIGHTTRYGYQNGLQSSVTDPDNRTTTITRDLLGRELRIDDPDGTWKTISYQYCSGAGQPANALYYTEEKETGTGYTRTYFDKLDRVVRKETEGFQGQKIRTDQQYNSDGTTRQVSDNYYEGDTPRWTTYQYDAIKRVVQQTLPGSRISTISYNGLTKTIINPQGQKAVQTESPQDKLLTATDDNNNSITYDYDSDLNLIGIQDPRNNTTTIEYDIRGFKTKMNDPDMGQYAYEYNTLGLITRQVTPKNEATTFTYDLLNRMIHREEPEGVADWIYDAPNATGELLEVKGARSSQHYEYDLYGRPSSILYMINSTDRRVHFTYNAAGRIASQQYPNGTTIRYDYTNEGHLKNVFNNASGEIYWEATGMNADNALTEFSLGNRLVTKRSYDPVTGYLTGIETGVGAEVQKLQYQYTALGNLLQRKDLNKNLTENFEYDNLNRLTRSQVTGRDSLIMQYDAIGNISFKSDVGNYYYGENGTGPHVLTRIDHSGAKNCVYPLRQNIKFTSYNYAYEISNVNTLIEIEYGAGREREQLRVFRNGLQKLNKTYFGGDYEEIRDSTMQLTELCYIKAGNEVVAYLSKNERGETKTTYIHTDHLGSVSVITGKDGTVEEEYSYDPWGKARDPLTWGSFYPLPALPKFLRGFTFHEPLDIDGLICMNARVYNPILGRFVSPDPFVQFPDDLQSLNRFSYVLNNPLAHTDPSGFGIGSFFKRIFRFIRQHISIVVSFAINFIIPGSGTILGSILSAAASGFATAFVTTVLSGGKIGDAFKAGLQAALYSVVDVGLSQIMSGLFGNIDSITKAGIISSKMAQVIKFVIHGVSGGVKNVVRGGSFRKGFLDSIKKTFTKWIKKELDLKRHLYSIVAAVAGTVESFLGGTSFLNGAHSQAFIALYEHIKVFKDNVSNFIKTSSVFAVAKSLYAGLPDKLDKMLSVFDIPKSSFPLLYPDSDAKSNAASDLISFVDYYPRTSAVLFAGGLAYAVANRESLITALNKEITNYNYQIKMKIKIDIRF